MHRIVSTPHILTVVGLALVLCQGAPAQTAPPPLSLTLQDAMERARSNSPQILSANLATLIAREDTLQAKAALLPGVGANSQFIYTQPNGSSSGVFVSNNGPRVYDSQLSVHGDLYAPAKLADYRKTRLAEAIARAKAEIAGRGLVATVVQNYYGMVAAARRLSNARQSQREAGQLLDITQKLELGGEVAHSDTVKAQIQLMQRERDTQEAQLSLDKIRLGFAVFLFSDFQQNFTAVDDLDTVRPLPDFSEIQSLAGKNNPDIRAAQAAVQQQGFEIKSARAALLPSLSFDYFYGMDANEVAWRNREGQLNVGSAAQAQLTIPLWNWGAARSRVKQAELRLQQAKNDLTLTQRQRLSNLNAFYLEADASGFQIASLRRSMELSIESLRLTLLRYQAGEVTVLEVVDAQNTLVQARIAYDEGMVRNRVALANLQTLTGTF